MGIDDKLYGQGLMGTAAPSAANLLSQRFLVPPFSILYARDGAWQARKEAWQRLGLEGDLPGVAAGRKDGLTYGEFKETDAESTKKIRGTHTGTSMFDPVLCELCYRWFCPPGGQVVDPFAGGACRGVVAALLGLQYWGCDLRLEQVESNRSQAAKICPGNPPTWVCGDSRDRVIEAPYADFIFSCPPYGDLEQYSNNPADLSNMAYSEFRRAYTAIIGDACACLKDDRFAVFVVGDYRLGDGTYAGLPAGTQAAFIKAGLKLYNEAILVTVVGSASLRVSKQFNASRKLAKTHQNVLVFVKGDPKRASEACKSE